MWKYSFIAFACLATSCNSRKERERDTPTSSARPDQTAGATSDASPAPRLPVRPFQPDPAHSPERVVDESMSSLTIAGDHLVAVALGPADEPARVVIVNTITWALEPLGEVEAPATLIPVDDTVIVAAQSGLLRMQRGTPPLTLHAGRMASAVLDGRSVVWAACPENGACTVGRTDLATAESQSVTAEQFDVVNDLAMWRGDIWVAGRHRDPREGVTPSAADQNATARWLLAGDGSHVPPNGLYAPGYLARIDSEGRVSYQDFPTQRPASIAVAGDDLLVLTEGTPGTMFADGTLLRIGGADDEWTPLATGLSLPDDLTVNDTRACWQTMPASRFEVQCWDRTTHTAATIVSREWNVLGFADDGAIVTFSVLTKGLFRLSGAE